MKAYQTEEGVVASTAVSAAKLQTNDYGYQVIILVGSKELTFYTNTDNTKATSVYNGLISDLGWTITAPAAFGG